MFDRRSIHRPSSPSKAPPTQQKLTSILPSSFLALVGPNSTVTASIDVLLTVRSAQVPQVQLANRALHHGTPSTIEALTKVVGSVGGREGGEGGVASWAVREVVESG